MGKWYAAESEQNSSLAALKIGKSLFGQPLDPRHLIGRGDPEFPIMSPVEYLVKNMRGEKVPKIEGAVIGLAALYVMELLFFEFKTSSGDEAFLVEIVGFLSSSDEEVCNTAVFLLNRFDTRLLGDYKDEILAKKEDWKGCEEARELSNKLQG